MTHRPAAAVKASLALAAAAATPHFWVAVPTLLYTLHLTITEARLRRLTAIDQDHPHA